MQKKKKKKKPPKPGRLIDVGTRRNVPGAVLEQFHFEIALPPHKVRRAAKTDPTGGPQGRACSPKGVQASRATRRGFW